LKPANKIQAALLAQEEKRFWWIGQVTLSKKWAIIPFVADGLDSERLKIIDELLTKIYYSVTTSVNTVVLVISAPEPITSISYVPGGVLDEVLIVIVEVAVRELVLTVTGFRLKLTVTPGGNS